MNITRRALLTGGMAAVSSAALAASAIPAMSADGICPAAQLSARCVMSGSSYDLNDLQSDVGHLGHVLETIHDVLMNECPFVAPGGSPDDRLPGMDRLAALLWIARDMANSLDKHIEESFNRIGSTTVGKLERAA